MAESIGDVLLSAKAFLISQEVQLQVNPASAITGYLGERLTLHMSDGRKQDFFVASSRGECKATGGPYQ